MRLLRGVYRSELPAPSIPGVQPIEYLKIKYGRVKIDCRIMNGRVKLTKSNLDTTRVWKSRFSVDWVSTSKLSLIPVIRCRTERGLLLDAAGAEMPEWVPTSVPTLLSVEIINPTFLGQIAPGPEPSEEYRPP